MGWLSSKDFLPKMRKLEFMFLASAAFVVSFFTVGSAQDLTCDNYRSFDESQKISLAYGYLEGVQAALDKDAADMLVPPSDPRHPMWWVLPKGLGANPVTGLAQTLDPHCQSEENRRQRLLDAFLSIAHQKGGWPVLGISFDKEKTDPWKRILGASVSCSAYSASREGTRQAIIDGYYLGTEALKVILKRPSEYDIVWPSKLSAQTVRVEVDKRCQEHQGASLREVLWLATIEMAVKQR